MVGDSQRLCNVTEFSAAGPLCTLSTMSCMMHLVVEMGRKLRPQQGEVRASRRCAAQQAAGRPGPQHDALAAGGAAGAWGSLIIHSCRRRAGRADPCQESQVPSAQRPHCSIAGGLFGFEPCMKLRNQAVDTIVARTR